MHIQASDDCRNVFPLLAGVDRRILRSDLPLHALRPLLGQVASSSRSSTGAGCLVLLLRAHLPSSR